MHEYGWETVRVANRGDLAASMDGQLVSGNLLDSRDEELEQSNRVELLHRHRLSPPDESFDPFRVRPEDANYQTVVL